MKDRRYNDQKKKDKGKTFMYKTLHILFKIVQNKAHTKHGVSSCVLKR
jgi:hypothetical protein